MAGNDLPAILAQALGFLALGARDPASPWRRPALATVASGGTPSVRTVVLRGFDPATRVLQIHTDIRSPKWAELGARPHAALHGWDHAASVQLRLSCAVRLETGAATAATWQALPAATRATYATTLPPGTHLQEPPPPGAQTGYPDPGCAETAAAFSHFGVLHLTMHRLEWLHLDKSGHRRAAFLWDGDAADSMWLAP